MWTPATRRQHSREGLRYETDLTDAEWALIEPHMPKPRIRGRPREWPLREVLNAIFYVLRGGVAWRLLPNDLPPRTTVFRWFCAWRDSGLFETLNHLLVMADRERVGREASPSAAVLDLASRAPDPAEVERVPPELPSRDERLARVGAPNLDAALQ